MLIRRAGIPLELGYGYSYGSMDIEKGRSVMFQPLNKMKGVLCLVVLIITSYSGFLMADHHDDPPDVSNQGRKLKVPRDGQFLPWKLAPSMTGRQNTTTTTTTTTPVPPTKPAGDGTKHRFKKIHSSGMLMTNRTRQLADKYWNTVYNPLPYGGPRNSFQLAEEIEASFRMKQASGLPVARTANREKERETAQLRLPIPDSEIARPGHYRQPFNRTLLLETNAARLANNTSSVHRRLIKPGNPSGGKTVNVEAFRILLEVIKSLRELGIENSTRLVSPDENLNM